jgi:phage I-like protein
MPVEKFQVLLDAPGDPGRRVPIARLGDYTDKRYGDFSITQQDVQDWNRNLGVLPGGQALIDLDHRSERAPRNSEAYGWMKDVKLEEGGLVTAGVEWTNLGKEAIADKRYLFFSPVYGPYKDEQGNVTDNVLQSGALTNKPFQTKLPTISLASEETLQEAVDKLPAVPITTTFQTVVPTNVQQVQTSGAVVLDPDTEERLRLLDTLTSTARTNLPNSAFVFPGDRRYPIHDLAHARNALARVAQNGSPSEQAAVKAAVFKKYPELKPGGGDGGDSRQSDMDPTGLLKLLDLPEDADETKVLEAVTALKQPAQTLDQQAAAENKVVLDAATYSTLRAGAEAGTQALRELAAERFERSFDDALRNGRTVPAQKESLARFYELDSEAALKLLDDGPMVVNTKASGWNNGSNAPTVEDRVLPGPGQGLIQNDLHQKIVSKLDQQSWGMDRYAEATELVLADERARA